MHVLLKCQILGSCQRDLRCDQTLDNRVISQVEEHRDVARYAALLKCLAEILRDIVLDAHRGKYDTELALRVLSDVRLLHNLCRQLIMRKTVAGENRQLLAANQSCQSVDSGNTCLNEVSRILAAARVQRKTVDIDLRVGDDRTEAVDRTADTIKCTAQDVLGECDLHRMTRQSRMCIGQGHTRRSLEDLNNGVVLIALDDTAELLLLAVHRELNNFIVSGVLYAFEDDERAVDTA